MKWGKLGCILKAEGQSQWMISHAANPTATFVKDDIYRIYFSSRDEKKRSSIGFIDIDLNDPTQILKLSKDPVLGPGHLGLFDDSGVSMASIVNFKNQKYLYYVGWNLGVTVPWRNSIGLAISMDGGESFQKFQESPIVDRSPGDPYSLSYPWVIEDRDVWEMWYGSNLNWGATGQEMNHVIKYAVSKDGINWDRGNQICLDITDHDKAFSRPCVTRDSKGYKMWYSYRGTQYRIGLAHSKDGAKWTRHDKDAGLEPSITGWDSEAVEYCHVFTHKDKSYMLYCGNEYGKSGFGLAVGSAS